MDDPTADCLLAAPAFIPSAVHTANQTCQEGLLGRRFAAFYFVGLQFLSNKKKLFFAAKMNNGLLSRDEITRVRLMQTTHKKLVCLRCWGSVCFVRPSCALFLDSVKTLVQLDTISMAGAGADCGALGRDGVVCHI